MIASGMIMARDQLLISQKLTWNHLPMRRTSHGMVGTWFQVAKPRRAK